MTRATVSRPTGNHLLDKLPIAELDRLVGKAETCRFAARDEVLGLGVRNDSVYFPRSGVYSLLLPLKEGSMVEVAVVDSEGMLGIPTILGLDAQPLRAVAQVGGECVRVPADRFLTVLRGDGVLDALVRRYVAVSWQTANQNIACNLKHTVRERTCRWLLSVHDRTGEDELDVTQEMLAEMVGASRPKVTAVAGELQASGFISYQRGRVRMIDRAGVESICCECYVVLKRAYEILTS